MFEVPSIGSGIDYSKQENFKDGESINEPQGVVDLSKALFHTSLLDESLLDISTQSYLDESYASQSFLQSEADLTISEILTSNNVVDNQISEIWNKKEDGLSRSTSGSSSPSIDDLITKRKPKTYAVQADLKLAKSFDEIKSKLAHQVKIKLIYL